jgi:ribonuclease E
MPSAAAEIEVTSPVERAPALTPAAPVPAERVIEPELPAPVMQAMPAALQSIVLPPELELIETNPEKVRVVASKPEAPQPPRPSRVRPPLPPVNDEPLVQIETQR